MTTCFVETLERRALLAVTPGHGLIGEYFDGTNFEEREFARIDSRVNFNWGFGGPRNPGGEVGRKEFSVRWSGFVEAKFSETYTFHTRTDDGVRLWVDDELLIDAWDTDQHNHEGSIDLTAGEKVSIRLEYFEDLGRAYSQLRWSSDSQRKQIVPHSALTYQDPSVIPLNRTDVAPQGPDSQWNVIFSDEFNGNDLNEIWHTAQWFDRDVTIVRGELQAYDASGISVSDGELHLTAREDSTYGTDYISGLVMAGGYKYDVTVPHFSFQYGFLEVRAKLPTQLGAWPAVWMLPASYRDNAELDIIEVFGNAPDVAEMHAHRFGAHRGEEFEMPEDIGDDYHVFGLEWQADRVSWYIDGVERFRTRNRSLIPRGAMYPLLNLAIDGRRGFEPDETTNFPMTMDVDYVRIWQRA